MNNTPGERQGRNRKASDREALAPKVLDRVAKALVRAAKVPLQPGTAKEAGPGDASAAAAHRDRADRLRQRVPMRVQRRPASNRVRTQRQALRRQISRLRRQS